MSMAMHKRDTNFSTKFSKFEEKQYLKFKEETKCKRRFKDMLGCLAGRLIIYKNIFEGIIECIGTGSLAFEKVNQVMKKVCLSIDGVELKITAEAAQNLPFQFNEVIKCPSVMKSLSFRLLKADLAIYAN